MEIRWSKRSYQEITYWQQHDPKIHEKVYHLLQAIKSPYEGLGKPEKLKFGLSGYWSRRINIQHHLVYRIKDGAIEVLSCMYHY